MLAFFRDEPGMNGAYMKPKAATPIFTMCVITALDEGAKTEGKVS